MSAHFAHLFQFFSSLHNGAKIFLKLHPAISPDKRLQKYFETIVKWSCKVAVVYDGKRDSYTYVHQYSPFLEICIGVKK